MDVQLGTSDYVGALGIGEVSYGGLGYHAETDQLFGLLGEGTRDTATKLVTIDRATSLLHVDIWQQRRSESARGVGSTDHCLSQP